MNKEDLHVGQKVHYVAAHMDFTNWKCRCSAISKILTNGKGSEPVTEKQWGTIREYLHNSI